MPEHYTKNTVMASTFCNKCSKFTMHQVHGGRLGSCIPCMEAAGLKPKPKPPKVMEEQPSLFAIRKTGYDE